MCYEMMQSKVHWASDYPIALFLGYITGKTIADRRITKEYNNEANTTAKTTEKPRYQWQWCSGRTYDGYALLGVNVQF